MTERLLLEPLAATHAPEMALLLDDPRLHRYVGGQPQSLEQLEERYERQSRGQSDDGSERWFNWIVRDRGCGNALGYVQATVTVESGVAALAWVIGSRFQGHGYATEATAAMASWLHVNGVTTLAASIHPGHRASEAVAAAIGLTPTSTVIDGERRWETGSCT